MTAVPYSFIDVAVLDGVRERFAAGDAVVILSTDLDELIWANGPGARLFGHEDIEAVCGAASELSYSAKRQLMTTEGFPHIGTDCGVVVRIARGLESRAYAFLASEIVLPDGEEAILLSVPAAHSPAREAEIAADAISGFMEAGHMAAFVDGRGNIEAATAGLSSLGITKQTLAELVEDAERSGRRLVKRRIPAGDTMIPAGIARLRDMPARHLLVVIDQRAQRPQAAPDIVASSAAAPVAPVIEASVPAPAVPVVTSPVTPTPVAIQTQPIETPAPVIAPAPEASAPVASPPPVAASPTTVATALVPPVAAPPTPTKPTTPSMLIESLALPDDEIEEIAEEHLQAPLAAAPTPVATGDVERAEAEASKAFDRAAEAGMSQIDRAAAPLRFVWRTDKDGRFAAISPEFVRAVGDAAGNVVGRSFRDVAEALSLDPYGEIAGLLERRDTWSGRSVFWPVSGTDLRVPVDLAALPVYARDRSFEGFRGFGVARLADSVVDPDALGQRIGEGIPSSLSPDVRPTFGKRETRPADRIDPFAGEVPVLSIVPKPDRRHSDKVIKLAEHRAAPAERVLSPGERSAFREIGNKLRGEDAPAAPTLPEPISEPISLALTDEAPLAPSVAEPTVAPPAPIVAEPETIEPVVAEAVAAAVTAPEPLAPIATGPQSELPTVETEAPAPEVDLADQPAEPEEPQLTDEERAAEEALAARRAAALARALQSRPEGRPAEQPADVPAPTIADTEPKVADVSTVSIPSPAAPMPAAFVPAEPVAAAAKAPLPAQAASAPSAPVKSAPFTPTQPRKADALRPSSADLKIEGFMPSAFAGPSSRPARPVQDTPILSRLPVPLLVHSGDVLHYANDEFLALTGYDTVEQLAEAGGLGALFADSYDDEFGEEADDRAIRLRTRDGLEFPIEALLRSVPWNGGKALMLVVRRTGDETDDLAEVVAPKVQAAPLAQTEADPADQATIAALKARVAEMRTIIDTATDGVVLITKDGTIRSISRSAEALFGFDSDDVTGKPFVSLFAIESQRAARDYLTGLSDNGVASVLNDGREVIGRESQGRFIPLFMTIGALPGESGYCAVLRDITQWKRAEEELTQAKSLAEKTSSQKTDFLARVSHEIRTPLNAIIGFSELMVDERFGPIANERYRDYLRDINRSGNHVLDLVNDLLDISKIEAGEQEMAHEVVSLNDTLAETVAMMQPQANRERVIIRSSFASRLPEVVADLRSVRQIALNILSNAVRYTQAGGQVIVSTAYEPSGEVVIRVRDTGIGMTPAEIEQAMKPFKQINAVKRARGDGTGLGLPLTKAMVEANRARFTITSSPGDGTLVEVTFPATRVLAD
jgi:PAS domain S-box-containing protein